MLQPQGVLGVHEPLPVLVLVLRAGEHLLEIFFGEPVPRGELTQSVLSVRHEAERAGRLDDLAHGHEASRQSALALRGCAANRGGLEVSNGWLRRE